MSRMVKKGHYIASRNLSTDDEGSQRNNPDYIVMPHHFVNDRIEEPKYDSRENGYNYIPPSAFSSASRENGYDTGSEIYVTSGAYKSPSELGSRYHPPSEYSPSSRRAPSGISFDRRSYQRAGLKIEAATAPNPFCPNARGLCCLMLLFNLGIILVTLGFVIVIQFHDPLLVWILGVIFLVFGCVTLIGSLIYCVVIFREVNPPHDVDGIYWTKHWQKKIGTTPSEDFYGTNDDYPHYAPSDRYSTDQLSDKYYKKNSRF